MRRFLNSQIVGLFPYILVAIGIVLSVLSMTDICSSACGEAHKYKFYGTDFGWAGMYSFVALGALWHFRQKRFAKGGYIWVLACACGAELWFIFVQRAVIKAWCPVCVSLAITIGLLAVYTALDHSLKYKFKEQTMRHLITSFVVKSSFLVVGMLVGFCVAFLGVAKPVEAQATTDLWLGKANSGVEVYIITDWFCPGCRKAEPEIELAVKANYGRARIAFVDYSIHAESTNFSLYNLSFQIYNKAQYLPLRASLLALAQKTKTPTTEDVQAAIKYTGVKYKQLPMSDVMAGLNAYATAVKSSGATATPTVIVRSAKTGKIVKQFVGCNEIKASSISEAVAEASRN